MTRSARPLTSFLLASGCLFAALFWGGCSSTTGKPLEAVVAGYTKAPLYSVVLEDMEEKGSFLKSYRQRFNVIQEWPDGKVSNEMTPWMDVSSSAFKKLAPFLGMTVLAKTADGLVRVPFPPGYNRVGDSRCGRWQQEGGDRSWYWNDRCRSYGRYVGRYYGGSRSTRPVLWGDWDRYRSRKADKPYFGSDGKTFGTRGSYTKKSNPTFYERQTRRAASQKSSFDQRSRARAGRSRGGRRGGK